MKKRLSFIIKLFFTVLLCVFIAFKADWSLIWENLRCLNPFAIVVVFLMMMSSPIISSAKWSLLLSMHNIHFHLTKLFRYYYIAMFFNNFLPTRIGGDVYRIYKTMNNSTSKSGAAIAILMERVTGVIALLTLGFVGGAVGFVQHRNELSKFAMFLGAGGLIIIILFFCALSNKRLRILLFENKKCPLKIKRIVDNFGCYRSNPSKIVKVFFISFIFQMLAVLRLVILVYFLDENCSIYDLAVVLCLSDIASLLPISINGIGVLDTTFIYLGGKYGVSYDSALTIMIVIRALLIPISLFGGALYFFENRRVSQNIKYKSIGSPYQL